MYLQKVGDQQINRTTRHIHCKDDTLASLARKGPSSASIASMVGYYLSSNIWLQESQEKQITLAFHSEHFSRPFLRLNERTGLYIVEWGKSSVQILLAEMEELKSTGNPAIHYSRRINFGFHKQPTKKDVPSAIFEISSPLEPNNFFLYQNHTFWTNLRRQCTQWAAFD